MNLLSDFIPQNIVGLTGVMEDLVADGNSVILVDHDTQVLSNARWIIEMGPEAGSRGGQIIAQGTVRDLTQDPASKIGPLSLGESYLYKRKGQSSGSFCPGQDPSFHLFYPYGKTSGGRHSKGQAYPGHRSFRFRKDHPGTGKSGPRSGSSNQEKETAGPYSFYRSFGYQTGKTY